MLKHGLTWVCITCSHLSVPIFKMFTNSRITVLSLIRPFLQNWSDLGLQCLLLRFSRPNVFYIYGTRMTMQALFRLFLCFLRVITQPYKYYYQLLHLCTARTAWSESGQAVRTVHSWSSWWLALLWSDSVIKLVSVPYGKCTILVVTKYWPMVIRQPCGDQWKAEKLGAFWR